MSIKKILLVVVITIGVIFLIFVIWLISYWAINSFDVSHQRGEYAVDNRNFSSVEPTRKVVKHGISEAAPFSLSTHNFPVPEGFEKSDLDSSSGFPGYTPSAPNYYVTFSPDGTRIALLGKKGGESYVFIDGMFIQPIGKNYNVFVGTNSSPFKFSDDSNDLYFIVYDSQLTNKELYNNNASFIVKKNRNSNILSHSTSFQLNIDNKNPIYIGPKAFTIKDFNVYSSHTPYLYYSSVNSMDGEMSATVWQDIHCGKWVPCKTPYVIAYKGSDVVFQSKRYGGYGPLNIVFSPDGKSLAYIVGSTDDQKNLIFINDKPGQVVDKIFNLHFQFSPDGKYLAYGAMDHDKLYWVVEEVEPDSKNVTVKYLQDIK